MEQDSIDRVAMLAFVVLSVASVVSAACLGSGHAPDTLAGDMELMASITKHTQRETGACVPATPAGKEKFDEHARRVVRTDPGSQGRSGR